MVIERYLLDKGFDPSLNGFDYIVCAIDLIRDNSKYKNNATIFLYPAVAKEFDVTPSKVERCIRHSIINAGLKTTNAKFIATAEIETRY